MLLSSAPAPANARNAHVMLLTRQRSVHWAARHRKPATSRAPRAAPSQGSSTAAALAGLPGPATAEVSSLSLEDLQNTLQQRGLSAEGGRQELEQRLAAFLADPAAFPEASCRPDEAVVLGGRLFANRSRLRTHIQLLLQLLDGQEVAPGHPDFAFLRSLLERHPRYKAKVRAPVRGFRVRLVEQPDMPPFRHFEYQDSDGAWEDFSYRKCIGLDVTLNANLTFRDAMRHAVRDQLAAFRIAAATADAQGEPRWRCDCCGKQLPQGARMRLEHVEPSFGELIRGFSECTRRQPPAVDGLVPGTTRRCFTDEAWLKEWRAYHRRHVRRLELQCMPCVRLREQARGQPDAKQGEAGAQPRRGPKQTRQRPRRRQQAGMAARK